MDERGRAAAVEVDRLAGTEGGGELSELGEGQPGVDAGAAAVANERDQLFVRGGERGARTTPDSAFGTLGGSALNRRQGVSIEPASIIRWNVADAQQTCGFDLLRAADTRDWVAQRPAGTESSLSNWRLQRSMPRLFPRRAVLPTSVRETMGRKPRGSSGSVKEKTLDLRGLSKRMMGLEPTTFCMATRPPRVRVTLQLPISAVLSAESSSYDRGTDTTTA